MHLRDIVKSGEEITPPEPPQNPFGNPEIKAKSIPQTYISYDIVFLTQTCFISNDIIDIYHCRS